MKKSGHADIDRVAQANYIKKCGLSQVMTGEDVTFLQSLILALVQGGTEFLPVSSSAHLILVSELMGWSDQGLVFDVAVHLGTLFAVLVYFRDELVQLLKVGSKPEWAGAHRVRQISLASIYASLPAATVGFWLRGSLRVRFGQVCHCYSDARVCRGIVVRRQNGRMQTKSERAGSQARLMDWVRSVSGSNSGYFTLGNYDKHGSVMWSESTGGFEIFVSTVYSDHRG